MTNGIHPFSVVIMILLMIGFNTIDIQDILVVHAFLRLTVNSIKKIYQTLHTVLPHISSSHLNTLKFIKIPRYTWCLNPVSCICYKSMCLVCCSFLFYLHFLALHRIFHHLLLSFCNYQWTFQHLQIPRDRRKLVTM